jgi:D-beta-D-heptose 7-phosphate kinase / D-beta-D-heptose 1-phosphate adenosyltransferase
MSARREPLIIVGDVLLDRDLDGTVERLAPDAPVPVVADPERTARAGGAGLAAALAAGDGRRVTLITAIARDEPGRLLRRLLAAAGVQVVDLGSDGQTSEKVRVNADGHQLVRIDYGQRPGRVGPLTERAGRAIAGAATVLVSDYGRGVAAEPGVRRALAAVARRTPVVWDPHPKGPAPVRGARLLTPNHAEAARLVPEVRGDDLAANAGRAQRLRERFGAANVVVTLGSRGALMVGGGDLPLAVPAPPAPGGDPCGAGDRFSAAAAGLLADGALPSEAVIGAVRSASSFVAAGGAAALSRAGDAREPRPPDDPLALARDVRERGGTVVATSGCFDLLHAGHVEMLRQARQLGDCLIVCLNSDRSVRRLKGPGRPLVPFGDRAQVLLALGSVDAVLAFDEDTPERALERLRPHVFAKGGDYAGQTIAESRLVASWDGQAVVLPYVAGRSTTRLLEEASRGAAG